MITISFYRKHDSNLPLQKYKRGDGETHELFFNLIEHLLDYEPEKRLTAKEAMSHPFFYGMNMSYSTGSRHSHSKSRWLDEEHSKSKAFFYYALLFFFLLFSFSSYM